MTKTDAKAATCTEDGNNEYYTCSRCGGVFKDEAGTQATTVEAETLKKLGHDWSNKDGICAVCHTKCDRVHKPGTTCSVCHKYTSYPYVPGAADLSRDRSRCPQRHGGRFPGQRLQGRECDRHGEAQRGL